MSRVIHFEIPVDDSSRASKFYTSVFGWKIEKSPMMDYWLATTGPEKEPGINGALTPRENMKCTSNTISVPSVDEFLQKVIKAGGKGLTPKMPIQGVGYFAYCQDTEGNMFGIMQADTKAGNN
jgi:predicted enzyme related to lactoylglutathione lyase